MGNKINTIEYQLIKGNYSIKKKRLKLFLKKRRINNWGTYRQLLIRSLKANDNKLHQDLYPFIKKKKFFNLYSKSTPKIKKYGKRKIRKLIGYGVDFESIRKIKKENMKLNSEDYTKKLDAIKNNPEKKGNFSNLEDWRDKTH